MPTYLIELLYLLSGVLFIMGLRGMSHPETARRGMFYAEFGMLLAIVGTLAQHEIVRYDWIIAGLVIGSLAGLAMGLWVPMTAMPQRTAFSHAFGAACRNTIATTGTWSRLSWGRWGLRYCWARLRPREA